MTRSVRGLATLMVSIVAAFEPGCLPDGRGEGVLKAPKEWDVKGDELTFGAKGLEAFNSMSQDERNSFLEDLKQKAGSFRGQARFQSAGELGELMPDRALGQYQIEAIVEEPVLFEITLAYQLFSDTKMSGGLAPSAYIEFTGTLAGFEYQNANKPRELRLKVRDVVVKRLDR